KKNSVSRHLPRHAGGDDRVRAAQGRIERREQHRARSTRRAPGDRPHRRVGRPRRLGAEAHRAVRPRRHDAPGRAKLRREAGHAGARDLRQRRHRAASPPLRGQRELPRPPDRGRPRDLGHHATRQADRDRRVAAKRPSLVRRGAVPPRVQVDPLGRPPALQVLHPRRARTSGGTKREGGRLKLCGFEAGLEHPLFLIAGPCVVESEQLQMDVAGKLKEIASVLSLPFIFKSSYDKANRSSGASFRGPGMHKGLEILAKVKREIGVPVLTDVHREDEIEAAAATVDVLQTPAFLCRQTDFIRAVAQSGKPVNIKKGQFLAPHDMTNVIDKARAAALEKGLSEDRFLACERGASFGYNNLVSDMRSLSIMRETGAPVVFDATHSVQLPGGQGTSSGGQREFVPVLARAAVAVGVAGIFMETHPDPAKALSDGPNAVPLRYMRALLEQLAEIDRVVKSRPWIENDFAA